MNEEDNSSLAFELKGLEEDEELAKKLASLMGEPGPLETIGENFGVECRELSRETFDACATKGKGNSLSEEREFDDCVKEEEENSKLFLELKDPAPAIAFNREELSFIGEEFGLEAHMLFPETSSLEVSIEEEKSFSGEYAELCDDGFKGGVEKFNLV